MGANIGSPPPFFIHNYSIGDKIFEGDSPNPSAWTDLDVSGKCGARVALLFIQVINWEDAPDAPAAYAFRRAGPVRELRAEGFPTACDGVSNCYVRARSVFGEGYVLVQTDNTGHIDWFCNVVDHHTIFGLAAWLPIKDI